MFLPLKLLCGRRPCAPVCGACAGQFGGLQALTCLWEEGRRQQAGVEEGGSRLAVCSGVFLEAFFCHVHVFGNLFRL